MKSEYIALVRSNPCSKHNRALTAALADAGTRHAPATVFFHGDGCEMAHALVGAARQPAELRRFDLRVCTTSWTRRYALAPPPPLHAASLVFFFQRLAGAQWVESFSPGGWFCCRAPGAPAADRQTPRLLLEVASAPADSRQQRETLEVVLGAAALELEAGVLFQGSGLAHLAGDVGRGWRQITDFGLMEMFARGAGNLNPADSGVVEVNSGQAARLRAGATTILLL